MPPEVTKIPSVKVYKPTNVHVISRPIAKPIVVNVKVTFEIPTAKIGERVATTGIKEGRVVRNASGQALKAVLSQTKRGELIWGEATAVDIARAEEGNAQSLEKKWSGGAYVPPTAEAVNPRGPTPAGDIRAYRTFAPFRAVRP